MLFSFPHQLREFALNVTLGYTREQSAGSETSEANSDVFVCVFVRTARREGFPRGRARGGARREEPRVIRTTPPHTPSHTPGHELQPDVGTVRHLPRYGWLITRWDQSVSVRKGTSWNIGVFTL